MKKKSLYITSLLVLVNVWTVQAGVQGALPGAFSVSATKKVYFSQGNLQYQASTNTWRFAASQYTYVGSANKNISSSYTGWIDLFYWGTGNNPTLSTSNYKDYQTYYEWGANKISNGGNIANLWRTLSESEWNYIYNSRTNAAQRRSCGTVNGIYGYIILPDNWSLPSGVSFTANAQDWTTNSYSLSNWNKMEEAGAVFLPAAGWREGKTIHEVGDCGSYASSSFNGLEYSRIFIFRGTGWIAGGSYYAKTGSAKKWSGLSVRLVINSDKNISYTITWKNWDGTTLTTTSVAQGATPSYTGSTPTRPSTAQYTYTFSGWTPAITAATANKTYTATYTSTPRYTITFNANGGLIPTGGNMGNTPSGHITTLSTDRTSGTVVVTKDKSHFQTMTNDCPSREGYTFAGWYTDPTSGVQVYDNTGYRVVGTYWNNEGNWIGTSNVTLYAHWTPIPYTITVNSSNVSQGTAAGGGTYDYGTNHQLTATPNECYRFVQWSDGNTDNPRTIIVNGDATYTAEFSSAQYIVKVESSDESQGTVGVELVSTVGKENDRIYYTSSDGNIVTPYSATVFGANIVSNTYQDGQGVMIFDRPVVGIGEEAFWNCDSLTSITIPNSVTSIGDFAFGDCESLTSVTIPNSVKSIGEDAFYYCSSLTSITIPNSVASIGRRAFYECFSLSSVTIPNSVTIIREAAFGECLSLTSITIPNSVTIIEYEAFISCISLTSITIPNSVTSIDIDAFGFCDSLTSINVADDNPNYCSMDGVLFSKDRTTLVLCPEGKQGAYTIPNSVTSIGEDAFNYSSLISVTIPNSVTSIGYRAFTRCSSLTSISIPNSVTSIGKYAFEDCESLTSVTFEGLTPPTIGEYVFNNTNNCPIYIPYGTKDAYVAALNVNNTIDASRVIEK